MGVGPEENSGHTTGEACEKIAPLVGMPEGVMFPYLILVAKPDGTMAIASNAPAMYQQQMARYFLGAYQQDRKDKSGLN